MKSIPPYLKLKIDPHLYNLVRSEIIVNRMVQDNTALYYDKYDLTKSKYLLQYLNELGIVDYIKSVGHTVIKPMEEIPVHVDNYHTYIWSLTIPFKSLEGTYNRFFEDEGELPFVEVDRDYGPYAINKGWMHPDPDLAVYAGQVETNGPILLNTSVPHSVVNLSKVTREALVIRLNKDFDPDVIQLHQA